MRILKALRPPSARRLARWGLFGPAVVAALALGAGYAANKTAYVVIRDALFTDYNAVAEEMYLDLPALANAGYRVDNTQSLRVWRPKLEAALGAQSLTRLEASGDDTARAEGLARLLAQHPAVGRTGCGFTDDLSEKATELAKGTRGCCSDFTQMFVALSTAVGMPAREVTSNSHGFNEFYDRQLKKWVFIDAQFGFIVRGHDNVPLSALAFRDAVLNHVPHQLEFFQEASLAASNRSTIEQDAHLAPSGQDIRYYSPEGLAMLAFPWGNNVFEATEQNLRLQALPKPAARLVSHLSGVRPRYVAIVDGPAASEIWKRRLVAVGFYALLASWGAWAIQLWLGWRRAIAKLRAEPVGDCGLSTAPPQG